MIEKMPPNLSPTPTFSRMKVPYLLLLFEKPALFDFAQPRRAVRVPVIELRKKIRHKRFNSNRGVCCRGVSHHHSIDQSHLSVSLQGCLDRTPGCERDPDLRNVEKFMLNDYIVGVWGLIRTGWK